MYDPGRLEHYNNVLGTIKGNMSIAICYCKFLSDVICSIFLVSGFKNSDPDDYQRVVRNCDVKVLNNLTLGRRCRSSNLVSASVIMLENMILIMQF